MELARRCIFAGQSDQAMRLYKRLGKLEGWESLVLSEMGVALATSGDESKAVKRFEEAIAKTTPDTMEALNQAYRAALGESYWSFWTALETLAMRQCQNHAWLAGLRTRCGDSERGRAHVRSAIELLDDNEMAAMRPVLAAEMVRRFEQLFPELNDAPELASLRDQVE